MGATVDNMGQGLLMSEFSGTEFQSLREDIGELRLAMTKVAEALERLARLEERHASSANAIERAFTEVAKLEVKLIASELRLTALEVAQPLHKKSTEWIDKAVLGAVTVIALVILKKVGLV